MLVKNVRNDEDTEKGVREIDYKNKVQARKLVVSLYKMRS